MKGGMLKVADADNTNKGGDDSVVHAIADLQIANPGRDFVLISKGIERSVHQALSRILASRPAASCCTLFLTTYGGDPHAAYRIARCLRHHYKEIRLVVPSYCKSAGTLIAIGATELGIGDMGELGPLDIQVSNPSEFNEQSSGLDIQQALNVTLQHSLQAFRQTLMDVRFGGRLSTKLAGEFAARVVAGIALPLYQQIDPNRLGELQRAMSIAKEYGERLNGYSSNLKNAALERLIATYPSHSFVIDRKEAKDLFHRVGPMTPEERRLCDTLWNLLESQRDIGPIILNRPQQNAAETGEQHEGADHQPTAERAPKPPDASADAPARDAAGANEARIRVRRNGRAKTAMVGPPG